MVIDRTDLSYLRSVRTLLGVDVEDTLTLPDESITDMTVLDMAEMEIVSYLPDGFDLTLPRVRMATIYMMAVILCPTMPARVDVIVKGIDTGWTRKAVDYEALAEKLLGQVSSMIDALVPDEISKESDLFRIAPSKRAVNQRHEC